jgi:hypothetical protein
MDLELLRDRRVVIGAAIGALALFAILAIVIGLAVRHHRSQPALAESSEPRSLQVEIGHEDVGLDANRPLRCFVGGQFVGMTTLSDCAKKNGVAPGGLDVGLDQSGAIAATTADGSGLQPLPSAPEPPGGAGQAAPASDALAVTPLPKTAAATGSCWRYAGDWNKFADEMTLDACVQALFAGHCKAPGQVDYGRWNGNTLRLVTGRVEIAADNRTFRTLARQTPEGCAIQN